MTSDTQRIDFLFLPKEHDPDTYVQEFGLEGWKQALTKTDSFSTFMLSKLQADCDLAEPEGRAKLLALAKPLLSKMSAPGLRLQIIHRLSELTQISVAEVTALVLDLGVTARNSQAFSKSSKLSPPEISTSPISKSYGRMALRSGLPEIERRLRLISVFSPKLAEDLLHEDLDGETISEEMRQWLSFMESFHAQASSPSQGRPSDGIGRPESKNSARDWIATAGHELALEALAQFAVKFGTPNQQTWAAAVRQDALSDYGGLAGLGPSEVEAESREILGRLKKISQRLELQRLSRSTDPADLEKFKELLRLSKAPAV